MMDWRRSIAVCAGVALLAGCTRENVPLSPIREYDPELETVRTVLLCRAEVNTGRVSCTVDSPTSGDGVAGALLGGQGTYVLLASTNVEYDVPSEICSADVTVRNLLAQMLGTVDRRR